ncbi:MAG: bifunctional nuclease family protein [Anaerolineales bacterium]|nr:bifunctional nuclease family protein [Anaerolineales bacterium]
MTTQPRDSELVQQARAGSRAAFAELLTRHRPLALRLAARLLGGTWEAEDVLQEAGLQAWLNLDRLRDDDRFGPWLGGIALNLAKMRLRAHRHTYALEDLDGGRVAQHFSLAELAPSPEAVAETLELHRWVLRALETLPAEQQAVVRLHYWDGLTLNEISAFSGARLGTLKARLHRAREKLRAQLLPEPSLPKEQPAMIEVTIENVLVRALKFEPANVMFLKTPEKDVLESASRELPPPGTPMFNIPLPPPTPPLDQRVVILKEKNGPRVLPIWIGPFEADALSLQLAGTSTPRPMTFDLTARLLEAAQAKVERVTISRLQAEVFYATLTVHASGQTQAVDARPSDALNLALRLSAPIFVAPEVMDSQSVPAENLQEKLEAQATKPEFMWVSAPAPVVGMPKPPEKP